MVPTHKKNKTMISIRPTKQFLSTAADKTIHRLTTGGEIISHISVNLLRHVYIVSIRPRQVALAHFTTIFKNIYRFNLYFLLEDIFTGNKNKYTCCISVTEFSKYQQ